MKKYLFFFLLMSLLVCKVNAKEIEVGFSDGNIINLDDSNNYESEEFKYLSKENKIILNNANLKYIIINGSIREKLLFELIGDSYIINNSGLAIENYNSDIILEGSGKLFITTEETSAVYMENSNMYVRTNGDFESKATDTIHIKTGELIIEKNADLKVKSDGQQAIFIEFGLFEVNDAKINAISTSNPIVIYNYFKPYFLFKSVVKTNNVIQGYSSIDDYNRYIIGYVRNIEISSDNISQMRYELKVEEVEGGKIVLNKNRYFYGERLDYEIVPDEGYKYKEGSVTFSKDILFTNSNSEARMLETNLTISCMFEKMEKYNVNLYYNEGGSFDKDDTTTLYENENYVLNIETLDDYDIKSIKINDEFIENNSHIEINNLDKDYDIVVEFELKSKINEINEENELIDDDLSETENELEEIIKNPETNDKIMFYEVLFICSIILCVPVFLKIKLV